MLAGKSFGKNMKFSLIGFPLISIVWYDSGGTNNFSTGDDLCMQLIAYSGKTSLSIVSIFACIAL